MYATSSHRKHWTFSDQAVIDGMRAEANSSFIESVKGASEVMVYH